MTTIALKINAAKNAQNADAARKPTIRAGWTLAQRLEQAAVMTLIGSAGAYALAALFTLVR